ncbi:FAD-binding oxidoreductase [Streptomyces sp. NPDC059582]|uniref:FAD-binding oxidoreductase n=1 Tax=Streptomyces sp. NPDC059582 TaxID=3346875 RepID=UPI0036A2CC9B
MDTETISPAPTVPAAAAAAAAAAVSGPDEAVLARCLRAAGPGRCRVITPRHGDGMAGSGAFRDRGPYIAVSPGSVDEVRALLRALAADAPRHGAVRVQPCSTGLNWGFGADRPADDGAVLLHLGGLDTVRDLDLDHGIAVVEPGVSQGALARRLENSPYLLNVTASSSRTSVVGNALDRGVGLHRQRTEDILGLEVVLADGTIAHVGRWPRPHLAPAPYPHPVGPGLADLFVQSGLGVVTAAAVRLLPRPQTHRVVRLAFAAGDLPAAVEALAGIQADRLCDGVVKVFSAQAATAYGGTAQAGYLAYVHVGGAARLVDCAVEVLTERAAAAGVFGRPRVFGPHEHGTTVAEHATLRAYAGDPSANDAMVHDIFRVPADRTELQGSAGWLFFTPVLPLDGASAGRAAGLLAGAVARHGAGMTAGHTLNLMPGGWVDLVVSLRFERDRATSRRAQALLDTLHDAFAGAGFTPYRLDIDHAGTAAALRGEPGAEDLLARLESLLDPHHQISRGRYAAHR